MGMIKLGKSISKLGISLLFAYSGQLREIPEYDYKVFSSFKARVGETGVGERWETFGFGEHVIQPLVK